MISPNAGEKKIDGSQAGSTETVTIGFDKLKLLLHLYVGKVRKANDWAGPLGILISLLLAILVTDFKSRFGITGPQWLALAGVAAVAAGLWFVVAVVQFFRAPSADSLLTEICSNAIRRDEWRVLFFLKNGGHDHLDRVLVLHDPIWDCFHLPHMRYAPDKPLETQEPSFRRCIAGYLGLEIDQVFITYMEEMDLVSVKHSERAHQGTTYFFKLYCVRIRADKPKENALAKKSFEIGGVEFSWLTLNELDRHVNTFKKNQDVLNHLNVNYADLFDKVPNSMSKLILADASNEGGLRPLKSSGAAESGK
jgi:hypothetical protein